MNKFILTLIMSALTLCHHVAQANEPRIRVKSDTGVQVNITKADWLLQGPFAEQTLELGLSNPSPRAVEATLYLRLDNNQQIKTYALDIAGRFRDAVPVERAKARAAFEEVTYRQVDPSLVEKESANTYKIRVFPIPARGSRQVRITLASLAQTESCGWQHEFTRLQEKNDPAVMLNIASSVRPKTSKLYWYQKEKNGIYHAQLGLSNSLSLCIPSPKTSHFVSQQGSYSMQWVEAQVESGRVAIALPSSIELVWDASLSMRDTQMRALQVLDNYFTTFFQKNKQSTIDVLLSIIRNDVEQQHFKISQSDWPELRQKLLATPYDGATDFSAWTPSKQTQAVFIFSDLMLTGAASNALPSLTATPVYVFSLNGVNPSYAKALTQHNGAIFSLDKTIPDVSKLFVQPERRLSFSELDKNWYAPTVLPVQNRLRACFMTQGNDKVNSLPVYDRRSIARQQIKLPAAVENDLIGFWCANWQVEALELDPIANKGQLQVLGNVFSVLNSQTSLLVLESPLDYVNHGVQPPASDTELYAQVQSLMERNSALVSSTTNEAIKGKWNDRITWWNKKFPKGDVPPPPPPAKARAIDNCASCRQGDRQNSQPLTTQYSPPVAVAEDRAAYEKTTQSRSTPSQGGPAQTSATLSVKAVKMDAPYATELASLIDADDVYQRFYLGQRAAYLNTPAFYFDVADRLFEIGDSYRAQRVLSNLLELMPNDLDVLRTMAYRLQQAGLNQEALVLLLKLKQLAPDQAQTWRDLGLLYAKLGQCDQAISSLSPVALTRFKQTSGDIDVIALAEMNDVAKRCPSSVFEQLDANLKADLPIGLRVVLKWDQNATDIDLHIKDPNGQTVYYGSPNSYQGGHISRDVTNGFGPEEFILKTPKPGVYTVLVKYYGSRMSTYKRGTTVGMTLQTNFATDKPQTQELTFRLLEQTGIVPVAEFEVTESGGLKVTPSVNK